MNEDDQEALETEGSSDMTADSSSSVLVRFFPGLRIVDTRRVARILFWKFPDDIDEFLPQWAHERARQFAQFYKDNRGRPLSDLVCATIPEAGDNEEAGNLDQEISYASDILCYSEQAATYGASPIRLDHFISHHFRISRNSQRGEVVLFSGLGHRTIVGLGAELNYYLPPFMRQEFLGVPQDEPLIVALSNSLERLRGALVGELEETAVTEDTRVLRSIGWYNQSGFRYSSHSYETLILHAATALESLLDLPREGTTAAFRNTITLLLGNNSELRRWCAEFYNVRSRIIHGDKTPLLLYGARGHRPHLAYLDFSRTVFEQCMISILSLRNLIPIDPLVSATIRSMTIERRLTPNSQRLQEIAALNPQEVFTNEEIGEYFTHLVITIDADELNSITLANCDAAIRNIVAVLDIACERQLREAPADEARELLASLRVILENELSHDALFEPLHQIDRLEYERRIRLRIADIRLWTILSRLMVLVDMRRTIEHRNT